MMSFLHISAIVLFAYAVFAEKGVSAFLDDSEIDAATDNTAESIITKAKKCKISHKCTDLAGFVPGFCNMDGVKSKCGCTCSQQKSLLNCGMKGSSMKSMSKRIVGGSDAQIADWPWVVSITAPTKLGKMYWMAGTILSRNLILTAKSGFDKEFVSLDASEWSVSANHSLIYGAQVGMQTRRVKQIIPFSKEQNYVYKKSNGRYFSYLKNDIALLVLEEPLELGDGVRPLCLPREGDNLVNNADCHIASWGYKKYFGGLNKKLISNRLQEAEMPIIPNKDCNAKEVYNGAIPKNILCAGHKEGMVDGCLFDAGTALACKGEGHFYQAGILSSGYECARANAYGLYTPVLPYMKWIVEKVINIKDYPKNN